MLRSRNVKSWFYPFDFMQSSLGPLFVGYEASARLSELARQYPDVVESERDGKYLKRRINLEALKRRMVERTISEELREVANAEVGITLF